MTEEEAIIAKAGARRDAAVAYVVASRAAGEAAEAYCDACARPDGDEDTTYAAYCVARDAERAAYARVEAAFGETE